MKTRRRELAILLGVLVSLGCACGTAQALLFNDWATDPDVVYTDTTTDDLIIGPFVDITRFWYYNDGARAYFRLDFDGAPGQAATAPDYMIYIDDAAGGDFPGLPGDYISDNAFAVDWIVDGHQAALDGSWPLTHYHDYSPGDPGGHEFTTDDLANVGGQFLQSGQTLEWSVPLSLFNGTEFNAYAAAWFIGGQLTWDTANLEALDATPRGQARAPEPATLSLAGLIAGIGLLMRWRAKKSN
ncbi:hypothetical protein ACFLSJ_01700 [Verrucomicrobiota bacterium]